MTSNEKVSGQSPARTRMVEVMTMKGLSRNTRKIYLASVCKLARHWGRAPQALSADEVRSCVMGRILRGLSQRTTNAEISALRQLFAGAMGQPEKVEGLRFRRAEQGFRARMTGTLDAIALKVMDCIERCRTPALGGVAYRCTGCGHVHAVWKSCGNRHCPSCQGAAAHRWMDRQAGGILPVPYFHVVFTLPRPVARIALQNRRTVLDILFRTAAETLRTIGADPARFGARTGGTAVLHTWNQRMDWHPHLHCLVPNAGFDVATGEWKVGSDRFLAPVKVLASRFPRRFVEELAKAHAGGRLAFHGSIAHLADPRAFAREMKQVRQTGRKAHAQRPFNGPEAVVRYLSRFTCCHLRCPDTRLRRRDRHLPLAQAGVEARRQAVLQHHDPDCGRLHPALPAAPHPERAQQDQALRNPRQRLSRQDAAGGAGLLPPRNTARRR